MGVCKQERAELTSEIKDLLRDGSGNGKDV